MGKLYNILNNSIAEELVVIPFGREFSRKIVSFDSIVMIIKLFEKPSIYESGLFVEN